jgi:DNA-binding transcriptional LysR family regulator
MELRKLRHAVVLARLLNFTKAAEALNLTQSALSRSIQALEEQCQLRLFDRNRNMVALTQVGHEFVHRAETLLRNEAELLSMVSHAARGESGSIALGMAPLAVRTLLAPLLAGTIGEPGFHADVTIGQPKRLIGLLLDETIDICVCTALELPASSPFARVELARFPLAFIVRRDHPLTLMDHISPQDLEAFPMVRTRPFELESTAPSMIEAMPQKRPAVTVEDYDVLMRVTAESDAVWITSPVAAREGIASGSLTQIPLSQLSRPREIDMTAYYLKRRTLSPLAEKILERMRILSRELNPA